jgi:hypothetical protein
VGFLLLFLAVWTVGVFAYKVIGGGDVHTRAIAARDLIGGDGPEVRTYILDLGQRSFTEQYSPTEGYGSAAPICRTTGWDYNTQANSGIKRQAAMLAIAYQNSTIMASAMRRIFTLMKEDATYAADDTLNSVNLCDPILDEAIVLKQAPVVRIRYAQGIIAGVCLKDHCNFGSGFSRECLVFESRCRSWVCQVGPVSGARSGARNCHGAEAGRACYQARSAGRRSHQFQGRRVARELIA